MSIEWKMCDLYYKFVIVGLMKLCPGLDKGSEKALELE